MFFIAIGLGAGLIAVFFITLFEAIFNWKTTVQHRWFKDNPYGLIIGLTITHTIVMFVLGDFAFNPYREAIKDLFREESLKDCEECTFQDR
eukprot:UN03897